MTARDSVLISAAIVAGFAIHGRLTQPLPNHPSPPPMDPNHGVIRAAVISREPKTLNIGSTSLLAVPSFDETNNTASPRWDYFQLDNGRLTNVPVGLVAQSTTVAGNSD